MREVLAPILLWDDPEEAPELWQQMYQESLFARIRVQLTSSCFPRWNRNLNTSDQRSGRHQPAHQRVFHDAERLSWIELPPVR